LQQWLSQLQCYQDRCKSSEESDAWMTFPDFQSPFCLLTAWQQNGSSSCECASDIHFRGSPGAGSWVCRIHW
jgi:hypothetical protein